MRAKKTRKGKLIFVLVLSEKSSNVPRNRTVWFNTLESYNPAIHRVKQAMFHCAVVNDITTNPLPPPHPELLKYFEPPKKVLKRAKGPLAECKNVFKVKESTYVLMSFYFGC